MVVLVIEFIETLIFDLVTDPQYVFVVKIRSSFPHADLLICCHEVKNIILLQISAKAVHLV